MLYKIKSDEPISVITIKKVRDCLLTANPAHFLKEFVENFTSFDGKVITLGRGKFFLETLKID